MITVFDIDGRVVELSHPINILSPKAVGPLGPATYVLTVSADGEHLEWAPASGSGSISGSGAAGQVALWDGTSSLEGNPNFTYDGSMLRVYRTTNGLGLVMEAASTDIGMRWLLSGVTDNPHWDWQLQSDQSLTLSYITDVSDWFGVFKCYPSDGHVSFAQNYIDLGAYTFTLSGDMEINTGLAAAGNFLQFDGTVWKRSLGPYAGYSAFTGTPDRSSVFDTSTVSLVQLAARVAAIQEDLTNLGIFIP